MYIRFKESPIHGLLESMVKRPYIMAQERALELFEMTDKLGIIVGFTLEQDVLLSVDPETKNILLGIYHAERLWAAVFAYSRVFNIVSERGGDGIAFIQFDSRGADYDWMELLGRSLKRKWTVDEATLPKHLPNPAIPNDTKVAIATSWFLDVVGYMLLHEIGHLVRRHSEILASLRKSRPYGALREDYNKIEYEADEWAAHWLLDTCRSQPYEHEFVKRSTAVSVALAILASREAEHRSWGGDRHPDPMDRLLRFLQSFGSAPGVDEPEKMGPAWVAAVIVLLLHLAEKGVALDRPGGYRCCRDFLFDAKKAMDTLARKKP
jgi:hypothetical protein